MTSWPPGEPAAEPAERSPFSLDIARRRLTGVAGAGKRALIHGRLPHVVGGGRPRPGKWLSCREPPAGNVGAVRNVAVLMLSTVRPFELALYAEVFGGDRRGGPAFDFAVASERPGVPVATDGGLQVTPAAGLDRLAAADLVAIAAPARVAAAVGAPVAAALRAAAGRGARVMAVGAATYPLAAAGLADGRRVAAADAYAPDLAARFPALTVDTRVSWLDDHPVCTAADAAAGLDLCLHLVRTAHGPGAAEAVARGLVPRPYGGARSADDRIAELLAWTSAHLHEELSLDLLARRAFLSRRSFVRRFRQATGVSPYAWILHQRVRLAQRLLETEPGLGVEEAAGRAGFSSAALLRQHFRRHFGCSPTQYRRRFAARSPG